MNINSAKEKPAILVYFSSSLEDTSHFRPILYGIEEEGIPAVLKKKDGQATIELSYQAALDSKLGVGIGIGEDEQIILHFTKLPKNRPLFKIGQSDRPKLRILGANAARLVKGIPFKSFEENITETERNDETLSKDEIRLIVETVLKKLNELKVEGGIRL